MLLVKTCLPKLFVFVALFFSLHASAQVARFVDGVHYTTLPDTTYAKTLDKSSGKVDVIEVFWYGCAHCYAFDPLLESWVDDQATNINFSRSPLMVWSAMNKQHARLFFTMQQLGNSDELHSVVFDEVQKNRNPLADEAAGASLFAGYRVAPADFASAYNSFAVDTALRKAETFQKEVRIPSVPVLIVNGKYMVEGNDAIPTHTAMLDVVEFLIGKEKAIAGS